METKYLSFSLFPCTNTACENANCPPKSLYKQSSNPYQNHRFIEKTTERNGSFQNEFHDSGFLHRGRNLIFPEQCWFRPSLQRRLWESGRTMLAICSKARSENSTLWGMLQRYQHSGHSMRLPATASSRRRHCQPGESSFCLASLRQTSWAWNQMWK